MITWNVLQLPPVRLKACGWGGTPPLGYDIKDRQLIPNEEEKMLVNMIFSKYLELGKMFATAHWLNEQGYHSKAWVPRCGKPRGGRPFQKSGIQRILTNPVYIGKVAHHAKNKIYQGKHEAIVSKEIWEQAQEFIRRRIKDKNAFSHYQVHDSVLSRKLYDNTGRSFRLTTAKKQGKRFFPNYNGIDKYYLSKGWRDRFMLQQR